MRSCARGPAVRDSEGAAADNELSSCHSKRGQRFCRGRARHSARCKEFAARFSVDSCHLSTSIIAVPVVIILLLQRCQDWRCSGSALASSDVQPVQVPLRCLRIEIFGHNICGIVEAWDLCDGKVGARPRLILEPQESDVEVAYLSQALAAQDANGCTGISVHCAIDLNAKVGQKRKHTKGLSGSLG